MSLPFTKPLENLARSLLIPFFLSILLTFPLLAQEQEKEAPKTKAEIQALIDTYEENPGLISGAERTAYQKRFPFCNEFLKIHWLPKQEGKFQRGWWYRNHFGTSNPLTSRDKLISGYAFVEIQEESGAIRYYSPDTLMKVFPNTWKKVIEEVEVQFGPYLEPQLIYQSKIYRSEMAQTVLLRSTVYKNICAVTPDEKRAAFYSMNRASEVLTQEEKEALTPKIEFEKNRYYTDPKEFYSSARVLDINHDGKPDFLSSTTLVDGAVFSHPKGYRRFTTEDREGGFFLFSEVTDYSCQSTGAIHSDVDNIYYSTDGSHLFHTATSLDLTCDLTKLTTPKTSKGE